MTEDNDSDDDVRSKIATIIEHAKWLQDRSAHVGYDDPERAWVARAHAGLASFFPEVIQRARICQYLYFRSQYRHAKEADDVRAWLAMVAGDPTTPLEPNGDRLTDETIVAAIEAWGRKRGEQGNGAPDKWTATHRLLVECGIAGAVTPDALRKAWNRYAPK